MSIKSEIVARMGQNVHDLDLVTSYLSMKSERSQSSFTLARTCVIDRFYNVVGKSLAEMTYQDLDGVRASINAAKIGKHVKIEYWSTIKAYYEWCLDRLRNTGIMLYNQWPLKVKFDDSQRDVELQLEHDANPGIFTAQELQDLDTKAAILGPKYYIIEQLLKLCGARYSEVLTIRLRNLNVKERFFISGLEMNGRKRGKVLYFFPPSLVPKLLQYVANLPKNSEWLFPSDQNPTGHLTLDTVRKTLVSRTHNFRRTLNTLRAKHECPEEIRSMLLNQKPVGTNAERYTKMSIKEKRELYDTWHPF